MVGTDLLGRNVLPVEERDTLGAALSSFDIKRWAIDAELKCEHVDSLSTTTGKVREGTAKTELSKHRHHHALQGISHPVGSMGPHVSRDT